MQSQTQVPAQDIETRMENVQLEIEASIARLDAMSKTLCASTRDRLTRRLNRIPATLRATPLITILAPTATNSAPAPTAAPTPGSAPTFVLEPAQVTQPSRQKAAPKKEQATKKALSTTTATRKTRTAPAAKPAAKPIVKPVTKFSSSPMPSRHTATRAKKRPSDELSSENKENSPAPVAVKKARTATAPTKTAPTTRATRATSRQTAQVLSPKNNNARQKSTKTNTTRPR